MQIAALTFMVPLGIGQAGTVRVGRAFGAGDREGIRRAGTMAGERRVVTMLFCDVKGSTALAEQLDPEEWSDIINGAFERMVRPVYRYEGTVARLIEKLLAEAGGRLGVVSLTTADLGEAMREAGCGATSITGWRGSR